MVIGGGPDGPVFTERDLRLADEAEKGENYRLARRILESDRRVMLAKYELQIVTGEDEHLERYGYEKETGDPFSQIRSGDELYVVAEIIEASSFARLVKRERCGEIRNLELYEIYPLKKESPRT